MQTSGSRIRLFVKGALQHAGSIPLQDMQRHYLINVMRLRVGDTVALFNGEDGEWQGRVANVGKNDCIVEIGCRLRAQRPEAGPWLAFAPLKKTCTQFVVEKATELGASRLLPVFTRRTATDRVNLQRLRSYAIEAAEQSNRLTLPIILAPLVLGDLLANWPDDRQLLVMDCSGNGAPLLGVLSTICALVEEGRQKPPGLLVGPEGGFAEPELDDFASLPFVTSVRLGSRILRAETAALAALACWQAVVEERA